MGKYPVKVTGAATGYLPYFAGRRLAIATMHAKDIVIAPKVASALRVLPFTPPGVDTDQFGSFSGERPRELDAVSTARQKCEVAMELAGVDVAIASEGSFGTLYMGIPVNEEIVMLVDRKHGLEVIGRKMSHRTNFSARLCHTENELITFAKAAGFPSHALILRDHAHSVEKLYKGITDHDDLLQKFKLLMVAYGHAYVETDMRAQHNPTRMEMISNATDALLSSVMSCCHRCQTPGFGITGVRPGLACRECGKPTRGVSSYVRSCQKCGFDIEELKGETEYEEPMFCDYCNP